MIRYHSVGEAARLVGESARRTSDGFHKGWFDAVACPLVGGRRLIPTESFAESTNSIQMAGLVTAGLPATVEEEQVDTVNLDSLLVKNKALTYMLEVDGESMIDAHIADGDMVIATKTTNAKDGDIVIAEIDGEWTMKYLRKRGETLYRRLLTRAISRLCPRRS